MLFAFEGGNSTARIARQTHFGSEAFLLTTNATPVASLRAIPLFSSLRLRASA
jgi:hypothetical protein